MHILTSDEAGQLLRDGDTLLIGGSGGGHAVPEALIEAVERRFLEDGHPLGITSIHPVGLGDMASTGVGRFAHQGLLKRMVTGALVNMPKIADMAARSEAEIYTLPQGALSQLMRDMAAGRPGLITKTGLHTYVDPRHLGGKQSNSCTEELVELIELNGEEWLFYKPYHINVAFLRGTTADEDGNVTMEQEAVLGEMLSMAQATKRAGGVVVVQVKRLAQRGTLHPKDVKIPGMLVDAVVVDPDQWQTYRVEYSPSYAGELRVPLSEIAPLPFDPRKVITRRAAMELFADAICNLGAGVSTGIANVAAEENILEHIILTNEQGLIGGAPASGNDAGAAMNYSSIVEQPYQFDFYDGGGLDLAFLSFAEVDRMGNVNVSRFGDKIIGVGGFINISQNAKKVIFSGTFTAGGLDISWVDGLMQINREGKHQKFVEQVEQLSYSGQYAAERRQTVLYVTERAVFRLTAQGIELIEIAPGANLEQDIFSQMAFRPAVSDDLKEMDIRLFQPEPMNLAADLAAKPGRAVPARLQELMEKRNA